MISLTRHDDGFRATDPAKNTVRVTATAWEPDVSAPSVADALARHEIGPDEVETTVSARAERLEFPPVHAVATPVGGTEQTNFGINADRVELPPDDYLLRVEANVRVFLRVESAITLHEENAETTVVEFPSPSAVSIAFGSHTELPGPEITVPRTPEGVAHALSVASAANETTSPDRTWPTMRNRPAEITFGERVDVPDAVAANREDTGIKLLVPPRLSAVLPAASLIHYLGADVTVAEGADPRLNLDGRIEQLGHDTAFVNAVTDLLRRCFYLDCVARTAGPHGGRLSVRHTFDTLELDARRLYEAPMAERVRTYLDADFEAVRDEFPQWHLSMYVEPTYDNVRAIPHFLDALPFVFRPVATPLSEEEWLSLSLTGGGYESFELSGDGLHERTAESDAGVREVSNVDLIDPDLGPGRTHGWLAPGVPVDGFKAYPEAFHNRDAYLDDTSGPLSVTVVVNDTNIRQQLFETPDEPGMHDETDATVEHYRRRANELNVDVTVEEDLTVAELATLFESENDLVHFIGHHDDEGLDCLDGSLAASTVSRSRTETFFLNACGSFPFAEALIRKGSVAGGATFESVSDADAFEVGGTFAGLIVLGFSVERALAIASRQTIAPKDYVVVGDGTHRVLQTDDLVPSEMVVRSLDSGSYEVRKRQSVTRNSGMQVNMGLGQRGDEYHLSGSVETRRVDEATLQELVSRCENPILFGTELYQPDELYAELTA